MLTPINEDEGDHHAREFFRPEFISQRLGQPGLWQGGIVRKLPLENPVQSGAFAKLLQGRTPHDQEWVARRPYQEPRVQGWRFSLAADAGLSLLWGLSPGLVRGRIRLAHNQAVRTAIEGFEYTLNGKPWLDNWFKPRQKHALFAKFQSGASREQRPQLETTLFLFNLTYRRGGIVEGYAPEQVAQQHAQMQASYKQALQKGVAWALGSRVELPNELLLRMQGSSVAGQTGTRGAARAQPLRGRELFAAWQEQARRADWEPEKVVALLREAKLRTTWPNLMERWSRMRQYDSLDARQGKHSPLQCFIAMERGPQPKTAGESGKNSTKEPSQEPPKKDQDKWLGYTH